MKRKFILVIMLCLALMMLYSCKKSGTDDSTTNELIIHETDSVNAVMHDETIAITQLNSDIPANNEEFITKAVTSAATNGEAVDENTLFLSTKKDNSASTKNKHYLKFIKPYEKYVSIVDGTSKSCDLVLNVNGYLYCYSFSETDEETNFSFDDCSLIFDEANLTYYKYSNGLYTYMKVGINNGKEDIWLGRLYTNTYGITDFHRKLGFGYEDDAKDFNHIVKKATGDYYAGYIKKYDAKNHTLELQLGDIVDYDTYLAVENVCENSETFQLSDDVEVTAWSLSTTGEVFLEFDAFKRLVNIKYYDNSPCIFVTDHNVITGIYEILNP